MAMNKRHHETKKPGAIAPEGGVVEGRPYVINGVFGIAFTSALEGERVVLDREGGFTLTVDAVDTDIAAGTPIYFNAGRVGGELHNDAAEVDARYIGFVALDNEVDVVAGATGEVEVFIDLQPALAA